MVSMGSDVSLCYLHAWKDTFVYYVMLLGSLDNLCEYSENYFNILIGWHV